MRTYCPARIDNNDRPPNRWSEMARAHASTISMRGSFAGLAPCRASHSARHRSRRALCLHRSSVFPYVNAPGPPRIRGARDRADACERFIVDGPHQPENARHRPSLTLKKPSRITPVALGTPGDERLSPSQEEIHHMESDSSRKVRRFPRVGVPEARDIALLTCDRGSP